MYENKPRYVQNRSNERLRDDQYRVNERTRSNSNRRGDRRGGRRRGRRGRGGY
jgi:hypothetical protein